MRILMIQRFDLRTVGCAERIWRQAAELTRRGHTVTLIDYPHAQRLQRYPALREQVPPGVRCVEFDRRSSAVAGNLRRAIALARQADLIHLWKCYPDAALPALWASRVTGRPLHYDWDDWEGGREGIAWGLTRSRLVAGLVGWWERELPRRVASLTVASGTLAAVAAQWGRAGLPIQAAPVGADLELFHPAADETERRQLRATVLGGLPPGVPVAVYVGQLEVEQYPELALEALAEVTARTGAWLWIVGDGPQRAQLAARAEELGLAPHVVLTGYLPRERVAKILRAADVGLAPFADTQVTRCKSPLKIAEYLASGLPVVASQVGEAPAMIGPAGCCVPVHHGAPGLARALLEVLAHPDRAGLRVAARARITETYNWEVSTARLETAYRQALEEASPVGP